MAQLEFDTSGKMVWGWVAANFQFPEGVFTPEEQQFLQSKSGL